MTENQSPLFDVQIDETSKSYLIEIAKWSKFFGILGYILAALLLLVGFFIVFVGAGLSSAFDDLGVSGSFLGIFYIIIAALYFYPSYKMVQFAKHMPAGLYNQQQDLVTEAFANLKAVYRYFGIITIVVLGLYVLAFIGGLMFASLA
ncbi:MAG: DUF5362 domain-containing protein [Bacteroidetes bacterium]|jgi:hypothetical protein|uniref:DUF5362 family protein n=1 Tax=Phnomibacter sp. TaxID=2836217 RepID=UPI002FDDC328|nr:DUF5362 domain-containing protein [Bacteroidota bacterium]